MADEVTSLPPEPVRKRRFDATAALGASSSCQNLAFGRAARKALLRWLERMREEAAAILPWVIRAHLDGLSSWSDVDFGR